MKTKAFTIIYLLISFIGYSQFKSAAGGFAFASKAIISTPGYAFAGGGVILKGEAKASIPDSSIIFYDISFANNSSDDAILYFKTSSCNVKYSNSTGLILDAIHFVNNEENIIRDINLLDKPDSIRDSYTDMQDYPIDDYFYVEMNEDLIGTKTGEYLLLVDLLQTDVDYYSDTACYEDKVFYQQIMDTLQIITQANHFDNYWINDSLLQENELTGIDSLQNEYIKNFAIAYLFNDLLYSNDTLSHLLAKDYLLSQINAIYSIGNWTYNDEFTEYIYSINCETNTLEIEGEPNFTFLTLGYPNELYNDVFFEHKEIITSMRPEIFKYVTDFSRLSAFFRIFKKDYPELWSKLVKEVVDLQRIAGNTPRIIKK
nr:hypothetical protein [uncultured Draconibacterium sp.]